ARELGHVGLQVEHAGDVGDRAIALIPLKAARHGEQIFEPYALAAVVAFPEARLIESELAILDEQTDDAGHDRLCHGPAEQRRARPETGGVALADDAAVVDHDDGARTGSCKSGVCQDLIDGGIGLYL